MIRRLIHDPIALAMVLIAALLLLGCDQANRTGADGYTFDRAEWVNADLRVRLVLHDTVEDLAREARRAGADVTGEERVQAWGAIDAHGNCTLHIVDPRTRYMPEWIGHELTHCAFGRFHGAPVQ